MRSYVREPQTEFTKLLVHENQNMVFSLKLKETFKPADQTPISREMRGIFPIKGRCADPKIVDLNQEKKVSVNIDAPILSSRIKFGSEKYPTREVNI